MIVGLLGFIGSGKGTVGDILRADYGYVADSYAAPVKDAVEVIFGWNRLMLEGDTATSRNFRETPDPYWSEKFGRPFTPREALQLMGTEIGRNIYHPNLWVDALEHRMNLFTDYVVTDVRFPNEIAQIRRLGGKVVRVLRGPEPLWFECALEHNKNWWVNSRNQQVMDKFPDIHYSEFAWIGQDIDYTLDNNGNLDDLKAKVEDMINAFK